MYYSGGQYVSFSFEKTNELLERIAVALEKLVAAQPRNAGDVAPMGESEN